MSPTLPRTLKNLIAVTLLVAIALTPALWFSQGSFPVVPVSSWIPPVLFPILGVLIALGALLTLIEKNPSRLPLVISLILVAAALCNILRALPFYYMYALMLFALGVGVHRGQLAQVPNVFRLMLVSTYIERAPQDQSKFRTRWISLHRRSPSEGPPRLRSLGLRYPRSSRSLP